MAAARAAEAVDAAEPPVLRVPGDYPTVPEAVAAAQPGGGPSSQTCCAGRTLACKHPPKFAPPCPPTPSNCRLCPTGDTIEVAQGEHSWPGKIFVDKALTVRGFRDKMSGFPASFLRGRSAERSP